MPEGVKQAGTKGLGMSDREIGVDGRVSLAERLAQGRIPAGDALRYASLLVESLRKAHEGGRVHGFLTPAVVWLNGNTLELAAPPAGPRTLTPYTAPELLSGRPADGQGDIFSFGAIVYEMLTGRRAFAGDNPAALAEALKRGQPPSTGSSAADWLLAGCLAKNPTARWQQIQKVALELKLLAMAARKAEAAGRSQKHSAVAPDQIATPVAPVEAAPLQSEPADSEASTEPAVPVAEDTASPLEAAPLQPAPADSEAATAPPVSVAQTSTSPASQDTPVPLPASPSAPTAQRPFQAPAAKPLLPEPVARPLFQSPAAQPLLQALQASEASAIRGEVQQSENRLAQRLQLGEKALAVLNRAVQDALTGLRSQVSTLTAQVAGMQERVNAGLPASSEAAVPEAALARIEQTLQSFGSRMEAIEKGLVVLQDRVTRHAQESDASKRQVNLLNRSMTEDFAAFQQSLQKQEKAIDSARTAMAQTDDLVERLVEALEALQATVLERSGELTSSVN